MNTLNRVAGALDFWRAETTHWASELVDWWDTHVRGNGSWVELFRSGDVIIVATVDRFCWTVYEDYQFVLNSWDPERDWTLGDIRDAIVAFSKACDWVGSF
jgi:hypothetical protein